MTQLGAGSPKIVGRDPLQPSFLTASLHHVPDHVLRNSIAPHPARPADRSKNPSVRDLCRQRQLVQRFLRPVRDRDGADVTALADQINNGPVPLPGLYVAHFQADQFRPAQSAAEQQGEHGIVASFTQAVASGTAQHIRALLQTQPVPRAMPELLHALDAADSRRQVGTEQSGIGGLVRQSTNGGQLLIDGVGR